MITEVQTKPRLDKAKLAKFRKAFKLGDLTGKGAKISGKMPAGIAKALDERIAGATPKEKAIIHVLLHYSWRGTKRSTEGARLDTRSILCNVLGRGVNLAAATQLRSVLDGLPPAKLADLLRDLGDEDAFAPGVLSRHLLDPTSPNAVAQFDRLKGVLVAFPPEPARAGQIEYCADTITIGRDDTGRAKILNQALVYLPFEVPNANKNLDAAKVAGIHRLFKAAMDVKYGRQGVALECLANFRKANAARRKKNEEPLSLAESLVQWTVRGSDVTTKYGNGDCIVLAEELVRQLATAGIIAKLVGYNNSELTRQRPANGKILYLTNSGLITGGVTHADVIIPYIDEDGVERVITITSGRGAADKWFKDLTKEEFYQARHPAVNPANRVIGPDGKDIDTSKMLKDQLKFLTNLQMTNGKPDEFEMEICGIDIMAGKIYLNSNASDNFKGPRADPNLAVSVSLKDMLANHALKVTMKLWNAAKGDYDHAEMSKGGAMVATLMAIGQQFGQPDDFVDNVLTLAEHLDEYRNEVIAPEIRSLHD